MSTTSFAAMTLGGFLRERRSRVRPDVACDARRRTPGLRREEVAVRAGVSVTWYTWLEQERGGPPSADALERIGQALELDGDNRELLFLLAQHRPPPVIAAPASAVPAHVQRVLDAMPTSPAIVKTPTWDVVAWNTAATAVLADYGGMQAAERNVLRRLFGHGGMKPTLPDWEDNARFAVAAYRIDVARAGGSAEADALTAELMAASADFGRIWAQTDARSYGAGSKRVTHPQAGTIDLDFATFAVAGADGLTMIVFTPSSAADVARVSALLVVPIPEDRTPAFALAR